jgi:hypothetical protein
MQEQESDSGTPSAPTSKKFNANEETFQSFINAMFPGWQETGTLPQLGIGQVRNRYTVR